MLGNMSYLSHRAKHASSSGTLRGRTGSPSFGNCGRSASGRRGRGNSDCDELFIRKVCHRAGVMARKAAGRMCLHRPKSTPGAQKNAGRFAGTQPQIPTFGPLPDPVPDSAKASHCRDKPAEVASPASADHRIRRSRPVDETGGHRWGTPTFTSSVDEIIT